MDLENAKQQAEFKNSIHNTYSLIKRDTEFIPDLSTLDDHNKGQWVEHGDSDFSRIFEGLLDYCADEECLDNLDWNTLNYEAYGADYYEEKFPGFDPAVYEILAKSTEDKLVDNRIPPLKITHQDVVLTFD
jgi:alpha-L-fucosidase